MIIDYNPKFNINILMQDPNGMLINLTDVSPRFKNTPHYPNNTRAEKMYNKYLNNEINISGYLHEKIYGEILDDTNRTLTPCIKQHIYLIHYPAGGINNNDYMHLPIQYRREFYPMLKNHEHPIKMNSQILLMDNIMKTYDIPYKLADVITWYWSGSEDNYGYLHQQIINDSK